MNGHIVIQNASSPLLCRTNYAGFVGRSVVGWTSVMTLNQLLARASTSVMASNMAHFWRPKEFGEADLSFTKEYGTAIRTKATFGRDVLFTCDPKALQYILNTSGYNYPKAADRRVITEILTGRGLVWAEGTQHARHRKIMNPAVPKLKTDLINGDEPKVVNILSWLHRTTLDAIGEAAFGYKFHAIDRSQGSKLAKVPKASIERPDLSIVFGSFLGFLPSWLVKLGLCVPVGRFKLMHDYMKIVHGVAQDITNKQTELYLRGKEGSKDVMSILVRANLSENPKTKLSSEEIIPQMTTLFLAGHDTTATTTGWFLYQLAQHPEYQTRIREEIKAARTAAGEHGDTELTIADMESMNF
ncbi:hypothetical protein M422DRAFT_268929 [Sphaerobolus stellatus SS14]|uniref:Cytochrome P450 n=1 Tax=Sphaerobolus stellatus (strain SS14) TaxID=990650 RepID=A0A0C9UW80_SPHS4|nr:hypothetical protein M422DRAFT_268929 [Sphaerobolus stellatus SS14]